MDTMTLEQKNRRWRLLLGPDVKDRFEEAGACSLSADDLVMDEALAAIYDQTGKAAGFDYTGAGGQTGGKGKSAPVVARWLTDIRRYFKDDVVSVIQSDAIERRGLKQLLLEPETLKNVKPDLSIVSTLMSLRGKIPEKTKETARMVVRAVVEEINRKLETDLRQAVMGALNRREHSPIPSASAMDWKTTLRKNVKNYNKTLETIIPERFYFFDRSQKRNKWTVILDMDQSGSMADSVIYGSIAGCIFSGMSSLKTHVVAFDTEVIDLSEKYGNDPVDMIFGVQMGGGTDINKSLAYCSQFITDPKNTLFILLSDLDEGGNMAQMYNRLENMVKSGVKVLGMLALSDQGKPSYNANVAKRLSSMGIPCFACTPALLPDMVEAAIKGRDLVELAKVLTAQKKK